MLAAPCDEETGCSKDLSVALANRSAVLFSLKAFHLALDDIRLALESGQVLLKILQFAVLLRALMVFHLRNNTLLLSHRWHLSLTLQ